jgi:predicted PurR-regulated permease PerM
MITKMDIETCIENETIAKEKNVSNSSYEKVVPFIIFILALFLFFKIIEPMITILLSSILLTYIFYPLYKKIMERVSNSSISAILTILIIVIVISIPFFYIAIQVTQQGSEFYNSLSNNVANGTIFGLECADTGPKICHVINDIERLSMRNLPNIGFNKDILTFLPLLQEIATIYIVEIPIIIINGGFILFISFFLFKDGKKAVQEIADWLPIRKETFEKLVDQFEKVTYAVVFGQLFIALSQGILATIGFYIFGVKLPIFLGVLTTLCSLIPTVGAAIIWIPTSLYMILIGYITQNYVVLSNGIWLFAYGIFAISIIDNILRIKIMEKKADVHPIITILGVIGGVNLFGIMGLFLGPILLPLLMTYFQTFRERFKENDV